MARSWTRGLTVALVVPLTSCAVLVANAVPANANGSAAGIASNAWLVTDLAAQAANTAQTMPYDPVLEAELATSAAATTTTTAKPGVKAKPKASGKLGLIINTAVVLGGLAFEFGGGSNEPALPGGGTTTYTSNGQCGYFKGDATMLDAFSTTQGCRAGVGGQSYDAGVYVQLSPKAQGAPYSFNNMTRNKVGSAVSNSWNSIGQWIPYSVAPAVTTTWEIWGGQNWDSQFASSRVKIGEYTIGQKGGSTTAPATDPAVVPRYIDSEITCKSAGGGSQVFTQRTGPFTVTPGQPNMLPEAPQMSCPDGTWLDSGKRELATEGSTQKVPLQEPYQAPDWLPNQVTENPGCWPAGPTRCKLEIIRIGVQPEYACNNIPVGSGGHPCRDWWTDPRRPERYECRFGAKVLSLKRCEPYKRSFAITDGGPRLDPTPSDPDAPPAPPPPGDGDPTPDKTPGSDGCVPGWSELLSPWWVFKAASCALAWAFVPPPGHLDGIFIGLRDDWGQTTPGLWLNELGGMVNVPAGSCGGIPVDFNLGYGVGVDMKLGEACSGSMANAAGIVKLAVTAVLCVGGAFAGIRILGSGLGWAPGIGKGVDT